MRPIERHEALVEHRLGLIINNLENINKHLSVITELVGAVEKDEDNQGVEELDIEKDLANMFKDLGFNVEIHKIKVEK